MANEKSKKLEFRDPEPEGGGAYLTKSTAQRDMEYRMSEGYVSDSVVGNAVVVNPNPFGNEAYAGTDPIYQNYANEQNKPLKAEEGVEKKLEDQVRKLYETDDDNEDEVVGDYGMGGEARKAVTGGPEPSRYLVPGQEGYEEQPQGDAVRSDRVSSSNTKTLPEPPKSPSKSK